MTPARVVLARRPGPGRGRLAGAQDRVREPGRAAGRRHGRLGHRQARIAAPSWSPPAADRGYGCWTSGRRRVPRRDSPARPMSSSAPPASAADVPAGPAVVMCGHGERATSAASLLSAPDTTAWRCSPAGPRLVRRHRAAPPGGVDCWAPRRPGRVLRLGLRAQPRPVRPVRRGEPLVGGMVGLERTVYRYWPGPSSGSPGATPARIDVRGGLRATKAITN